MIYRPSRELPSDVVVGSGVTYDFTNKDLITPQIIENAITQGGRWSHFAQNLQVLGEYVMWNTKPGFVIQMQHDNVAFVDIREDGASGDYHHLNRKLTENRGYWIHHENLRIMNEQEREFWKTRIEWFERNGEEIAIKNGLTFTVNDRYNDTRFRNQVVEVVEDMGDFVLIKYANEMEAVERRVADYLLENRI